MDPLSRHNVTVSGRGDRFMMFAHGFGCDRNMWRFVAPQFDHPLIRHAELDPASTFFCSEGQ